MTSPLRQELQKLAAEVPAFRPLVVSLKTAGWDHDKAVIDKWTPGALKRQRWNKEKRDEWERAVQTPGTPEYQRSQAILKNQPQWEKLEGNWILHVPGRPVAAVPASGKKNSRVFIVFDLKARNEIAQIKKTEVTSWLVKEALRSLRLG